MAYSYVRYTGNGTTTNYTFPFSYLSQDHVKVRLNGVLNTNYTFLNDSTIQFAVAPAAGAVIEIRRVTPKDTSVVNFTDGSVLLERDLDLLAQFNLYTSQEAADGVEETISTDATGRWNAQLKRLGNLAPAVSPDEAVIKQTLDYEYPAVVQVASVKADISIVASDLSVPTSQVGDLGSITDPVDTLPVEGSSKIVTVAQNITDIQLVADNITDIQNAEENASAAAASASAAAGSASAASSSAASASSSSTSALNSKNDAASSASAAATSASNAFASATTATNQASAAASSASAASTSAGNASTSATNASNSASAAATSASNAASSATAAATSATNAAGSASTATTQASNASNSASAAATSASQASTSASNAASSATAAANSESAAATSATNAASSASTATTQASNAASSASAASGSATAAASSATAAAASASDAASSAASAAALLDNFDDRYLGPKSSAPTLDNDGNALVVGALYFDTTTGKMRVYTATGWVDASSAAQAALTKYKFVATAGQTTFSGLDANNLTLSYLAGGEVVALNGSVLVGGGDDYTASNGTSVVLTSGATAGDTLEVYAFASFSIASLNGSAIVNGTVTSDKINDILDFGAL